MDVGGFSDIGPREANEDSWYVLSFPEVDSFSNGIIAFAMVSDGMGGYQGGDLASAIVASSAQHYIENVLRMVRGKRIVFEPDVALREIVQNAQEAIVAEAQARGSASMGATFVGAFLSPTHAWIGHVGDSRAYLVDGGQVTQLTEDHSHVGRMLSHGVITEEEAQNHPDRNRIERALGFEDYTMDFTEVDLSSTAKLLLCSDGAYTVLSKDDLGTIVSRRQSAEHVATQVVKAALKAGTDDNTTAVVASIPRYRKVARKKRPEGAVRRRPVHADGEWVAGDTQPHEAIASDQRLDSTARMRLAPDEQIDADEDLLYGQEDSQFATDEPRRRGLAPSTIALLVAILLALILGVVLTVRIVSGQNKQPTSSAQVASSSSAAQDGEASSKETDTSKTATSKDDDATSKDDESKRTSTSKMSTKQFYVSDSYACIRYIDASGEAQMFTDSDFALLSDPYLVFGSTVQAATTTDSFKRAERTYRALSDEYLEDLRNDSARYADGVTRFSSDFSRVVDSETYLLLLEAVNDMGTSAFDKEVTGLAVLDADLSTTRVSADKKSDSSSEEEETSTVSQDEDSTSSSDASLSTNEDESDETYSYDPYEEDGDYTTNVEDEEYYTESEAW